MRGAVGSGRLDPASGTGSIRWIAPVVTVALLGILASCRHDRGVEKLRRGEGQEGQASWYGPGFDGRKTANGERFDQHDMTAAHRTLPFGTVVRVTRLDSGEAVTVRVNDRGPFVSGRIIDLALGAAREIGLDRDGVARVVLTVERWPDQDVPAVFSVQVGAFKERANATRLRARLAGSWKDVHIQEWYEFQRVRVGLYLTESEAQQASDRLRDEGFTPFVIREN